MNNRTEVSQNESLEAGNKSEDSKTKVDQTQKQTKVDKPEVNSTSKSQSPAEKSEDNTGSKLQPADGSASKKEVSVTEIFTSMKEQTMKMKGIQDELSHIRTKTAQIKTRKKEIRTALKSDGRVRIKISVLGKVKDKLREEDRLLLKAEREFIKNELILLNEQRWIKMNELKNLVGSNMNASKKNQILNKAMSNSYITRNRWSIEGRLLATLNSVIEGKEEEYIELLLSLQKDSLDVSEKGSAEFNKKLEDFLYEIDLETYILCSHKLKEPLYKAITLTLKAWNGEGKIDALILPQEGDMEEPTAPENLDGK